MTLNPVSGAIIPYTPPKSVEDFVDREVVKRAHAIFERSEYFSILRKHNILPTLLTFFDRDQLHNYSTCSKDTHKDVDQYVDRIFKQYFGKSYKELKLEDLEFSGGRNKLLNKAIKNRAPGIAIEKFFYILSQKEHLIKTRIWHGTNIYFALNKAIEKHAPASAILTLLKIGKNSKICEDDDPFKAEDLFINDAIDFGASAEVIRLLLDAGVKVDAGFVGTDFGVDVSSINRVLKNGASLEIIQILLNAGAAVTINTACIAVELGASSEVIQLLEKAHQKKLEDELASLIKHLPRG